MDDTPGTWLHENFTHTGSAFGLRIRRKLEEVQSPFQKIEMFESTDWGNVSYVVPSVETGRIAVPSAEPLISTFTTGWEER